MRDLLSGRHQVCDEATRCIVLVQVTSCSTTAQWVHTIGAGNGATDKLCNGVRGLHVLWQYRPHIFPVPAWSHHYHAAVSCFIEVVSREPINCMQSQREACCSSSIASALPVITCNVASSEGLFLTSVGILPCWIQRTCLHL